MKIQIIGVGVVGSAQAHLASTLGHEVLGFDPGKTESPYAKMVKELDKRADLTFICTPEAFADSMILRLIRENVKGLYVIKSTVPPGTTKSLMAEHGIHICHNPEFLRESKSFEDVTHPNFVAIGQCCPAHGQLLKDFYSPIGCPIIMSEPTTTETVKVTLNSYLATLITFWNEVDKVARALGVKTADVAGIATREPRVSPYGAEFFGAPFGGKCLPKDLDCMIKTGHGVGVEPAFLEAVRDFNRKLANANPV